MDTVSCPFLFLSGTRTYMKNREIAREGEDERTGSMTRKGEEQWEANDTPRAVVTHG